MLSRKAKHLACVTEILRFAQNDIHHLVCNRALVFEFCYMVLIFLFSVALPRRQAGRCYGRRMNDV